MSTAAMHNKRGRLHRLNGVDYAIMAFLALFALLILYPFYNSVCVSLVSQADYIKTRFMLYPKNVTFESYFVVFKNGSIFDGMKVTLLITIPDLTDYPNIKAMYDQETMLGDDLCTFNGKLMSLPAMRDSASYDFMINMGFGYRADWAEKLGMRKENDIYTWDEFMDLMQAFIEQDPGGNGAGNT